MRLLLDRQIVDLQASVASAESDVYERFVTLLVLGLGEESGGELLHVRVPCLEESGNARGSGRASGHRNQISSALWGTLVIAQKLTRFFGHQRVQKAAQFADDRPKSGRLRRVIALDRCLNLECVLKPVELVII